MKALSVRQPWAWLIVNGHKEIENRSWNCYRRGTVLIHASKGMTNDEYDDVAEILNFDEFLSQLEIQLPDRKIIERGGIVGMATITGCVTKSESPWFSGPHGILLRDAKPLPFVEFKGALGFFDVPDHLVQTPKAKP